MANSSLTQQALADDPQFRIRVRASLSVVAFEVLGEDANTEHHAERVRYAEHALRSLDGEVAKIVSWLVMRTNLLAFETSYDFSRRGVVTAAGDADIASQLLTDWNVLAGVPE